MQSFQEKSELRDHKKVRQRRLLFQIHNAMLSQLFESDARKTMKFCFNSWHNLCQSFLLLSNHFELIYYQSNIPAKECDNCHFANFSWPCCNSGHFAKNTKLNWRPNGFRFYLGMLKILLNLGQESNSLKFKLIKPDMTASRSEACAKM